MQSDREAASPFGRSGVTHREFSVLHGAIVAVPVNAGLSGACPGAYGGGVSMATRFSDPNRFLDSPGVMGEGGGGGTERVAHRPATGRGRCTPATH